MIWTCGWKLLRLACSTGAQTGTRIKWSVPPEIRAAFERVLSRENEKEKTARAGAGGVVVELRHRELQVLRARLRRARLPDGLPELLPGSAPVRDPPRPAANLVDAVTLSPVLQRVREPFLNHAYADCTVSPGRFPQVRCGWILFWMRGDEF